MRDTEVERKRHFTRWKWLYSRLENEFEAYFKKTCSNTEKRRNYKILLIAAVILKTIVIAALNCLSLFLVLKLLNDLQSGQLTFNANKFNIGMVRLAIFYIILKFMIQLITKFISGRSMRINQITSNIDMLPLGVLLVIDILIVEQQFAIPLLLFLLYTVLMICNCFIKRLSSTLDGLYLCDN